MENHCPMKGCDGSGHISGFFSSHRSLSGCPYSVRFSELQQQNEIKTCPVPGCNGLGNTKSIYSFHRSIQRCPMIRQRLEKYNLSISQMEEMLKKKPNMFLQPGGPNILNGQPPPPSPPPTSAAAGNQNKKIASNWNGPKANHQRNGQTRREIKMAKNRTVNRMSPSKMAALKKKSRIPIEWNKANKSNESAKNKASNLKLEAFSDDEQKKDCSQDTIKLKVLNCDIQSMDLVKEHRDHLSHKCQEMEQLFDELQEQEREWSQKITKQQKDIDQMVQEITDLKRTSEKALEILGVVCQEIHPMAQGGLVAGTESNHHHCLSLLEEIIENRHDEKEFGRLFQIIQNDPRLARLDNLF